MKQLFTIFFLIFSINCHAQTEFAESENGLMYSNHTLNKLKFIVDSLNLKFKVCDLNKAYQSKLQAKANYIRLTGAKAASAKLDFAAGISYTDFIKKYSAAKEEKELLVVKYQYKNYENKDVIEFNSMDFGGGYGHALRFNSNLSSYKKPVKEQWVFNYSKSSDDESIAAFYFTSEFEQHKLPDLYAKMILYSDCMVDTSSQIFTEKAKKATINIYQKPEKLVAFESYIQKDLPKLVLDDKDAEDFYKQLQEGDRLRLKKVSELMKTDKKFVAMFHDAIKSVMEKGGSNNQFEEYVSLYYSNETALALKRNRVVVGNCSMDISPRVHAMNIAKLAAETANWEIFLRSHLDIMNDNFERMSDGNYAWAGRKTYLKELEVLNINVADLLLGISLRIENPSSNHYSGDVGRLGRALAETKDAAEIENKMLKMIVDNNLDDYNRVVIYFLFLNYNYNLEDKKRQTDNKDKLANAVAMLPKYLSDKIVADTKGK